MVDFYMPRALEERTISLSFLASSWSSGALIALRTRIWARYEKDGRGRVWIAEHIRPDLDPAQGASQLEIADACLDAIENARDFVLLDTGEYGSRLGYQDAFAEASFLEMELFQAALLSKPITVFFVGRASETSPLGQLAMQLAPHVSTFRLESLEEAEDALVRHFDGAHPKAQRAKVSHLFSQNLIQERHRDWHNTRLFDEPKFMDGRVCGPTSAKAELDVAAHYLNLAAANTETNRILSRTWIAMRTLMPVHYAQTNDPTALDLWDRALRLWSSAAAWRGLHGHLWLGNVSVLGSLAQLRIRSGAPLYNPEQVKGGDIYDGLGSVYYSLSKRVPRRIGPKLLERALAYVEEGLKKRDPPLQDSLLPLRGSIQARRYQFRAAARDYTEAIDIAVARGDGSGQIGFLLTELGFMELFLLKPRQARQRIEEGLAHMTAEVSSPGFRVRALRKHALIALACGDMPAARASAVTAVKLSRKHQLYDQNNWMVRRLASGHLDNE